MLDVMERCFADRYTASWQPKLKEMVPSLGTKLSDEPGCSTRCGRGAPRCSELDEDGATNGAPAVIA